MAGKRDCSFAALFGGLEAAFGELAGTNQVSLAPGDPGTAAIGVRPKPRSNFGAARDSLFESRAPFDEVAAQPPKAPESDDESYFRLGVVGKVGVVERGPEVVLLLVEDVQPTTLRRAAKFSGFHDLQEIPSVTVRNAAPVVGEQFERVLANGLEHPEPWMIRVRHPLHHAVGDEPLERGKVAASHVGRRVERCFVWEDGEPGQHLALAGTQKLGAPIEGIP